MKTKVCKICGEEKTENELLVNKNICKVCDYLKRHKDIKININWSIEEYRIILDCLLNKKVEYINQICPLLKNKTLYDLCNLLRNDLKIAGKTQIRIKSKCKNCCKDIYIKLYQYFDKQDHFCSYKCNGEYQSKIINKDKITLHNRVCQFCNSSFTVSTGRVNAGKDKYCSKECSQKAQINRVLITCDNCGKEKYITPSEYDKSKNHFCNNKCADIFRSNNAREKRTCEICGVEFECLKSSSQKMCSIECQGKWQSANLSGENANGYNHNFSKEDREKLCEWCNKLFYVKPYEIEKDTVRFCCKECRQEWHKNVWCQLEENKLAMQKRAIKILEDGLVSQTESKPQLIVNSILDDLEIRYTCEKGFEIYAVDNYLNDYNLIIENMGTYWHCDHRKYKEILYEKQVNRIRMDKIKHSYLLNNYNIEVLYLWEEDIINNTEMCKELIKEYINNNGKLNNYHSFNYSYNSSSILNNELNVPYMEWDINNLKNIINISIKEKMSHKQQDKWTIFNCEYCGKEKEQLTSHYIKSQHHYCSKECSSHAHMKRFKVTCNNCGTEIEVIQDKYETNKRFFCNQNCQHEYQRNFGFKWDCRDLNVKI